MGSGQSFGMAAAASQPVRRPQNEVRGPDGANLFVYNIPNYMDDLQLAALFQPFGTVISSSVFRDKVTTQSKGFGFVSYDNPDSAAAAINTMNGFPVDDRKLKVQIKDNKNKTRPAPY